MARRTAGTTTLVALVLLGVACCAHAQVESPRVRDRRHRELTRGMNEQQREQMRMLSEQGLTGEQISDQMTLEKSAKQMTELVKAVRTTFNEAAMIGREGRSELSSWNKNNKNSWTTSRDNGGGGKPGGGARAGVSKKFKPARLMKHNDLPRNKRKGNNKRKANKAKRRRQQAAKKRT